MRRLGFAVKVLGREDLPSHDTRRWQSEPSLGVSIDRLSAILEYLRDTGIRMYRISSDFVPYATHPEHTRFHGQVDAYTSELAALGQSANRLDIRLSLHPSQYIVLNSEDDDVARKAMWDLDVQGRLLDAMEQGPEAVLVLHVGGVYGNKLASLDRFARNFERLSEPARRRLVIENDDRCYTLQDCMWIHERIGVPVVFDPHHHRVNPGTIGLEAAARRALAAWPEDVVPKVHFSSPRLDARRVTRSGKKVLEPPILRQHADYIDPWSFADFVMAFPDQPFDVMLEAKAKDLALLKLRRDLESLGLERVLAA